jgi:hypothetical protein
MPAKGKDRCAGRAAVFLKSDGHVGGACCPVKVHQRAEYFCDGHHNFLLFRASVAKPGNQN